ncbi:MAG: OmpA family protein [candidate division Zixibacteria bacterium]|nr:OmpA family protein [candidate division Zixibacteria bacterium]
MRKASILLVGLLFLLLFSFCGEKPPVEEEVPPPVVEEPEPEPEPPPPPPPPPKVLKQQDLQPIYFDFDKYVLRPGDRDILNRNAQMLKEFPTANIKIEGNCDERGTVEYNLVLGDNRARAAKDYLVNLGIDPDRIELLSWGREKAKDCHNEGCWSKDRRDDFMIVSQ